MDAPSTHHPESLVKSTRPSTRRFVVGARFAEILSSDFGIQTPVILRALEGEPKREAIAVTEWAIKTSDPAGALLSWAKKHQRGAFKRSRRNLSPAETRAALDQRHKRSPSGRRV